ncbi:MAG: shikimate kinase [Candidatus Bathyarchaeota archaeon]|nr:shikimate kinase [Candidatus Bathyarchaeota archaeon]
MAQVGKAVAHGAITVINAISCGFGAALGVGLKTEATVRLTNEPGMIEGRILSDPKENTTLIEKVVARVLGHFDVQDDYGALVETSSNIPIARGLKSSSVAANAIALATVSALGMSIDDLAAVNLGVDGAMDAKVTITGAFDDACASHFGGLVVTDNSEREILHRFEVESYDVLIYAPAKKAYTSKSNIEGMKRIAREVRAIHKSALSGEYWAAMTINGILYSTVLGFDPSIAVEALSAGAMAAGLSGTGPAVAAVVPKDNVEGVRDAWQRHGCEVIRTQVNHEKAYALR